MTFQQPTPHYAQIRAVNVDSAGINPGRYTSSLVEDRQGSITYEVVIHVSGQNIEHTGVTPENTRPGGLNDEVEIASAKVGQFVGAYYIGNELHVTIHEGLAFNVCPAGGSP